MNRVKVDDGKTVKRYKKKQTKKDPKVRYEDVFSPLLPSFDAAFRHCAHRQTATFTSRAASVCLLVKTAYYAAAVRKQWFDTFHDNYGDQPKEFCCLLSARLGLKLPFDHLFKFDQSICTSAVA